MPLGQPIALDVRFEGQEGFWRGGFWERNGKNKEIPCNTQSRVSSRPMGCKEDELINRNKLKSLLLDCTFLHASHRVLGFENGPSGIQK